MVAIPPHDYPGRSNKVKSIKFPEDKLRKKFYDSQVGKGTEATPLYESSARSICDEFVKVQKEMMSKKMSEAEAFAEAETIINQRMKNTSPVSKAGKNSQKVIHDLLQSIKDAQANKMLGGAKGMLSNTTSGFMSTTLRYIKIDLF
ncbi:hypothetical protein SARC_03570 [Sphaeroforma arctica JP610]|uniref:Small ribosomal subunit protein mS23 conserved domain-containing protein n=1 Tax=Sphaeroforma arctica JP610 TaxID=667725 RepID=A0A0L0G5J0_9EUKA|nr:hypothetical protein SARC_03570 [Sphaeroforma arctica JP610]KNC84209.1 hypothetical protein SARC_03570 [Sphaeroforma arctica JP610]|eukprot:XP_014158111.1 hypothetical protein SARC_03570 [Sphaeroforma arctica JP610]